MRCRRLKEKFYKATITASIICLKTRCWQIYDSFSAPGISCLLTTDFNTTAPHFTSSTAVKHTNVTSTQIPRQCLISGSTCQGLFLFFLVHLWWQFCAHIVPHTSSPSALSHTDNTFKEMWQSTAKSHCSMLLTYSVARRAPRPEKLPIGTICQFPATLCYCCGEMALHRRRRRRCQEHWLL